jgi:hypothetical protein
MAVPYFLNTGFKYLELASVSDVQQIMDAFAALVSMPDDPSTGWKRWYTNADNAAIEVGEYRSRETYTPFQVKLVRSTQYRMSMRVRSVNNGVTIGTRGIQIPSANTATVRIFVGDGHALIDCINWSYAAEFVWGGGLDVRPDNPAMTQLNTIWMGGSRDSGFNVDSYNTWEYTYINDRDASPSFTARGGQYRAQGGSGLGYKHYSGAWVYRPRELWAMARADTSNQWHWFGRAYQMLIVPDMANLPKGSRIQIPIDTGVLGEFTIACGPATSCTWVVAVRSA